MLILYRYLALEFVGKTLVAAGILNFVMLLINLQRRAMDYIVNEDYPLSLIAQFVGLLLPWLLSYSLPWSILVATLLIFGRLSADHELVAMRSCGISMGHVIAPFMILAMFFTAVSIYINSQVAPRCQTEAKRLFTSFAVSNPMALFETEKFNTMFRGYSIYVQRKKGNTVEGVNIYETDPLGYPVSNIRADWGEVLQPDLSRPLLVFKLYNARVEARDKSNPADINRLQYGRNSGEYEMTVSLESIIRENMENRGIGELTFGELMQELLFTQKPRFTQSTVLVELHKRLSMPFACFTFVLIGIPLGIRVQRSEKSVGILVSFLVAMVYYVFVLLADALRSKAGIYPELFLWLPNLIFNVAGLYLLWKQNRI